MKFSASPTKALLTFDWVNIRYQQSLINNYIEKKTEVMQCEPLILKLFPRHFISPISLNHHNDLAK